MRQKYKILIALLVVVLVSLFLWKKYQPIERASAIASVSRLHSQDIEVLKIPSFYKQRDTRWAKDKLGSTSETVGKVGCLVSSICMNFSYYQQDLTPKELNQKLTKSEGYTPRGWLIWNKLHHISNNKLSVVFPKLSHQSIEEALVEKKPILAKVYIHKVVPHWVLIVGKKNNEYLILDPLKDGKISKISDYGDYIYSIRLLIQDK